MNYLLGMSVKPLILPLGLEYHLQNLKEQPHFAGTCIGNIFDLLQC